MYLLLATKMLPDNPYCRYGTVYPKILPNPMFFCRVLEVLAEVDFVGF